MTTPNILDNITPEKRTNHQIIIFSTIIKYHFQYLRVFFGIIKYHQPKVIETPKKTQHVSPLLGPPFHETVRRVLTLGKR